MGYFRRRLRRRLFAWFGMAILLTGLLSGAATWLWTDTAVDHERSLSQFTIHRFESVWDKPRERQALAQTLASDLGVGVRVYGNDGTELEAYGAACQSPYQLSVPDRGEVSLCPPDSWKPRRMWVPFVVGGLVLWIASGVIAFHLTRPLAHLVQVTKAIGKGDLNARMTGRVRSGELATIADAINDMASRIQSMVGAERELLASVSHEIRTPLGHLRILLDTARDCGTSPSLVDELDQEVEAIDALVGQLLANSRLDFDRVDRRVLDAVALTVRALERADVDPTALRADAETINVRADATLLLQALANLIRNAQEHGNGVTMIEVSRASDFVEISVEDHGPGFEDVDRAFELGYQGADGKGALGLGLALVRRVADAHGGTVTAENHGAGARVRLRIPD